MFCGVEADGTREHVVPKWARRSFAIPGPVTVLMGRHAEPTQPTRQLHALNYVLDDQICAGCNNGWLSKLENDVAGILREMVVRHEARALDGDAQRLLATWAVKTAMLLEPATRQQFPGRPIEGFLASEAECAWMFKNRLPPPRAQVWLSCWDSQSTSAIVYEPSGARLSSRRGPIVQGQFTTFSLGFVAFQVFSVDFIRADELGAYEWNPPQPPAALAPGLAKIWPQQAMPKPLAWPAIAFAHDDWHRLVTWGGVLRKDQSRTSGHGAWPSGPNDSRATP